jgi:hypothetical protein
MRILGQIAFGAAIGLAVGCGAADEHGIDEKADSGEDSGGDTETQSSSDEETDGTDDVSDGGMDCQGACEQGDWNECTCDISDPCGWSNNGQCNGYCIELGIVDEMFDESDDCIGECTGLCQSGVYVQCTCDSSDPCAWSNDGYCDDECILNGIVEEMFDDAADCSRFSIDFTGRVKTVVDTFFNEGETEP